MRRFIIFTEYYWILNLVLLTISFKGVLFSFILIYLPAGMFRTVFLAAKPNSVLNMFRPEQEAVSRSCNLQRFVEMLYVTYVELR